VLPRCSVMIRNISVTPGMSDGKRDTRRLIGRTEGNLRKKRRLHLDQSVLRAPL
jgi:hypothetical protein